MVRLARGAARGSYGRGRGAGPPPLMIRPHQFPIHPPHLPHPRMRGIPPPGLRAPPFAPPMPPIPPRHMRPPPTRVPPVPPISLRPGLRRPLPYPPRHGTIPPPHAPVFPPHIPLGPPHMPIPPPARGRGRLLKRGLGRLPLRGHEIHSMKLRNFGTNFKPKRGKNFKARSEGEFFCLACDRGFKTEEKLQEHEGQHVVCGIDGCTLKAHEKIVEKHIRLLHDTGLYKKVGKIDSPEEIEKWIAERKKNYPTRKNVEEKKAKYVEMERRGERIHKDNSRFAGGNNKKKSENHKEGFDEKKQHNRKRKRVNKLVNSIFESDEVEQEDTWRGTLPHFPGIAAFIEEAQENEEIEREEPMEKDDYSDDEWENGQVSISEAAINPEVKTYHVAPILNALCAAYGSDSDSSSDEPSVKDSENLLPSIKEPENDAPLPSDVNFERKETDELEVKYDSGPEEAPIVHQDNSRVVNGEEGSIKKEETCGQAEPSGRKRKRSRKSLDNVSTTKPDNKLDNFRQKRNFVPKKRLTLLQKLLEPQIRHERNVILQCIRYVVDNNFFGIDKEVVVNQQKIQENDM